MDDLISRQAAIDTLDKHLRTTDVPVSYPGIISALTEWLNELPSAQADSKELSSTHKALDTISRKAAIDAIMDADVCVTWNGVISDDDAVDIAIKSTKGSVISSIVNLPPAQPKKRTEERTETHACDLIDRQAAIDALHMHLMYRMGTDSNKKRLDDWINNLPSAQPEIIRCKDCKWYGRADKRRFYRGTDCLNHRIDTIVPDKDYCSRAERRTDSNGRD